MITKSMKFTTLLLTILATDLTFADEARVKSQQAQATNDKDLTSSALIPQKSLILKGISKNKSEAINTDKQINNSGGALGPIGDIIDDGFGFNPYAISITTMGSISPAGVSFTVTPDSSVPLSAYKKVECTITTKYFKTVTGSQPNDDVITTTPTIAVLNNKMSFVCPYKTAAHIANIAKSIDAVTDLVILKTSGGNNYAYNGFLLHSCTRANKTSSFTCN